MNAITPRDGTGSCGEVELERMQLWPTREKFLTRGSGFFLGWELNGSKRDNPDLSGAVERR